MKVDLKGYTALITGGSSGLGFEMAKALLLSGAMVVIAARAADGGRLRRGHGRAGRFLRGKGGSLVPGKV